MTTTDRSFPLGANRSRARASEAALSIRWPVVSLILSIVSVASLGTLVVVTAVKSADVLSTVALALAILAFAAQLIVSLTQSQESANQARMNIELNGDTRELLARIGAQSDALLANQASHVDKLLDYAIPGTASALQDLHVDADGKDSESVTLAKEDIEEVIRTQFEAAMRAANSAAEEPIPMHLPLDLRPSEVKRLVQASSTLSKQALAVLKRIGERARDQKGRLTPILLGRESPRLGLYKELAAHGLVDLRLTQSGGSRVGLTTLGARTLSAILIAESAAGSGSESESD